ncbi:hypothetical protein Mpsy_2868 [Methanolobus psychrophilus R15]|nr:hypothetical protein Mpsy_2868 [Methanolobus psychrophilus R15]
MHRGNETIILQNMHDVANRPNAPVEGLTKSIAYHCNYQQYIVQLQPYSRLLIQTEM